MPMPATPPTAVLDTDQTADLIGAIGTPGLGAALLTALAPALRCAHLSAFVFDAQLLPHQVMAESLGGTTVAELAGQIARSAGLYRWDPNTYAISAAAPSHDEVLTTRRRISDIAPDDQTHALYLRFALVDRVSLLARAGETWFALNLYRDQQAGEFDQATLAAWGASARLLAALLRRHFEWRPPPVWRRAMRPDNAALEKRLALLPGRLSAREQQVCARALRGITNPGIALDLGVQLSTVNTLRRRAFAKLGISTLGELFLLCLWPADASG
jgi:DNA-binding CsgD family transcriptional regulator